MKWQVVAPSLIPKLAQRLAGSKAIVLDVESDDLDWEQGTKPFSVGLSTFEEEKYYYLPLDGLNELDLRPLFDVLEEKPLMGHNIKFDLHMLKQIGWRGTQGSFLDTIVMARLWSKEDKPRLGLKDLAWEIFNFEWPDEKIVRAIKGGKGSRLDPRDAGLYCCTDVWMTKQLYKYFKEHLDHSVLRLFLRETQLTRDLYDIEDRGICIDQEYLEQATEHIDRELATLLAGITKAAGTESFNPGSSPQKRELMDKLGIEPVKMVKTGPSWDRPSLLAVRSQHPVALQLAKYAALSYQRNGMIQRAIDAKGILHGEFKNWGTITGRLSSNMQQMPKGWLQFGEAEAKGAEVLVWATGEKAIEKDFSIRRLIRPRDGHVLVMADYKQIEMFVLGYYMKDKTFTAWLDSGNVHAAAAEDVFGDPVRDYDKGKVYNFATVYGQGDEARAKALNCSIELSKAYKKKYDKKMPGHKKFLRRVAGLLRKNGYAENVFGRQYWDEPNMAYRVVNYLCQGSAGDNVKFKLPETRELREQIGCNVLTTTHDDFVIEIPEENVPMLPEWLHELRNSPFKRKLELDSEYSRTSLVELSPFEELLNGA